MKLYTFQSVFSFSGSKEAFPCNRKLRVLEEEKQRLESQILQDRADFIAQAKQLSQHFTLSHHRNTALQVSHESQQVLHSGLMNNSWISKLYFLISMQGELRSIKADHDRISQEKQLLQQHVESLQKEVQ